LAERQLPAGAVDDTQAGDLGGKELTDFAASWKVFGTLATGIVPSASYIPFSGLLQQAGFPGTQSLLITLVMLTNVAGNILLIPAFGALGAAAATAFSQVCFVFVLRRLVARKLAFSL
jgi:Na+-driven multidrug efflux pump